MKTVITKISCDSCGEDISPKFSGYEAEYILHVSAMNVAMHHEGRPIYAMMCPPPINNDLYFCGLQCMKNYGNQEGAE